MITKLEPKFSDGMPREVAIAILTEPKAKMTRAFRNTCKRALERHYVASPVLSYSKAYHFDDASPRTPVDPLIKWHGFSLAQLLKWAKRANARRAIVQREYETLVAIAEPTNAQKRRIAVLSLRARAFDQQLDCIDDELRIRSRTCAAVSKAKADSLCPPFARATRTKLERIRLDTQRGA